MKKIPIFFSFDNNYVPQASVTFESLLSNANTGVFYELFVVHSGIKKENIEKLHQQINCHTNAIISFIDVTNRFNINFSDDFFRKEYSGAIFTVETLYRCIPMLLPEFSKYDKIIYSDVDIVVIDDISELYDIDITDYYIAGANIPEFLSHEVSHLKKEVQETYIAGGLWVINLNKTREDKIGENILNIIKNPPCKMLWPDQDVLNIACSPKITFFSYRYISIPDWLPYLKENNFFDKKYQNKELYDAMYRPKIIHYAGIKPWGKSNRPLKSDLWYYWLSKTDFHEKYNKYSNIKAYYKIYLFGFLPLVFSKIKVRKDNIKIKLLKIIPFLKIKIDYK